MKKLLSALLLCFFAAPAWAVSPFPDVKSYGASGSGQTTTGTISASSTSLALAAAQDFVNGQGIIVDHAGAAATVGAPTPGSATAQNRTGSTTYNYKFASVDANGGMTAATSAVTTTTGAAALGTNTNTDVLGPAQITVTWTVGTGSPLCTAVWRQQGVATYQLLGCFGGNNLVDQGLVQVTLPWIPATPTASALADWLASTITSGGGTTSLTLANAATTAATSQTVRHDDTAAINAAIGANSAIYFPCGTYNARAIQINSNVLGVYGAGKGCTTFIGLSPNGNGLNSALSAVPNNAPFSMSGLSITSAMPMASSAFTLFQGINSYITGNDFGGLNGAVISSSSHTAVSDNTVSAWWNIGLRSFSSTDTVFSGNSVLTYSGHTVGNPLSTGAGAYNFGYGIEADSGAGTIVIGNAIRPNGAIFGVGMIDTSGLVSSNTVTFTNRECITAARPNITIVDNTCVFNAPNSGQTSSYDFGISMADDGTNTIGNVKISGNTIINPTFSGIGVAGSGSPSIHITGVSIDGNFIINPITAPAASAGYACGIQIMGSNTQDVSVGNNTIYDFAGHMTYAVCESNIFGTGYPNNDFVGLQWGAPGTSGTVKIVGSGSHYVTQPAKVGGPASY